MMIPRPFRSLPALLALSLFSLPATAQQAGLTAEYWNNLSGGESLLILQQEGISDRAADAVTTVANAEISTIANAGTGARLRGTLTPPADDDYTFHVAGASNVALWISEDASRFNKRLVAWSLDPTNSQEWEKYPSQVSEPIPLTGGSTYYIEAQVMDDDGGGHLAIAWKGANFNRCLASGGATATQSTTKWGGEASRAIDGNIDGDWGDGEVTHTDNKPNSWFQVDFGADYPINTVTIHNTDGSSQDRLSNFRISVLDASDNVLDSDDFFTTTGHVGDDFTWSMVSTVEARKVKIQLLGNNLAGNGYLCLAEVQAYESGGPNAIQELQLISSAYLGTISPDANDTNDNNLPDSWEVSTGLNISSLPGALLEYGDPDNDGITNYEEQYLGSDPLGKEAIGDGLTRLTWTNVSGGKVFNLTSNRARFHSYPNQSLHVPGGRRRRSGLLAGQTLPWIAHRAGDGLLPVLGHRDR